MARDQLPENKDVDQKAASRYLTLVGGALVGIIALPFSVIGVSTIASALTIAGVVGMVYGGRGVVKAQREANKNTFNEIKNHGTAEQQERTIQLEERIAAFKKKSTPKMYSRATAGVIIASGVGIVSTVGLGVMAAAGVLYATRSNSSEGKEITKQIKDSTKLAVQIRARRQGQPETSFKESKPM